MTDPYAPPQTEALPPSDDLMQVQLPGVSRKVTVKNAGFWSGARILVDGAPAEKAGWFGKVKIPKDDGSALEARPQYALSGLALTVGREKYPVGPQNPSWMGVLVFLPLALLAMGGAIGGLLGASAMLINRKIAGSERGNGAKVALMLLVFIAALAVMLVAVTMLQAAIGA